MIITAPESTAKRLADLDEVIARLVDRLGETTGTYAVIRRQDERAAIWDTECYSTPDAARTAAAEAIQAGHDVIVGVARITGLTWL